jgi:hypothetical protein
MELPPELWLLVLSQCPAGVHCRLLCLLFSSWRPKVSRKKLADPCRKMVLDHQPRCLRWVLQHYYQTDKYRFQVHFRLACNYGQHKVVKLLHSRFHYSWGELCSPTLGNPLLCASKYDHVGLLPWLCSTFTLSREDLVANDNELLCHCSETNARTALEWLHQRFVLTPEDARARNNLPLCLAVTHNNLDVLEWLVGTFQLTRDDLFSARGGCLMPVLMALRSLTVTGPDGGDVLSARLFRTVWDIFQITHTEKQEAQRRAATTLFSLLDTQ